METNKEEQVNFEELQQQINKRHVDFKALEYLLNTCMFAYDTSVRKKGVVFENEEALEDFRKFVRCFDSYNGEEINGEEIVKQMENYIVVYRLLEHYGVFKYELCN